MECYSSVTERFDYELFWILSVTVIEAIPTQILDNRKLFSWWCIYICSFNIGKYPPDFLKTKLNTFSSIRILYRILSSDIGSFYFKIFQWMKHRDDTLLTLLRCLSTIHHIKKASAKEHKLFHFANIVNIFAYYCKISNTLKERLPRG